MDIKLPKEEWFKYKSDEFVEEKIALYENYYKQFMTHFSAGTPISMNRAYSLRNKLSELYVEIGGRVNQLKQQKVQQRNTLITYFFTFLTICTGSTGAYLSYRSVKLNSLVNRAYITPEFELIKEAPFPDSEVHTVKLQALLKNTGSSPAERATVRIVIFDKDYKIAFDDSKSGAEIIVNPIVKDSPTTITNEIPGFYEHLDGYTYMIIINYRDGFSEEKLTQKFFFQINNVNGVQRMRFATEEQAGSMILHSLMLQI